VTLASAATTFKHHETADHVHAADDFLRPTLVISSGARGREREPTTSASPARAIVVAGAFTGGGGQAEICADRDAHEPERSVRLDQGTPFRSAGRSAAGLEPARLLRSQQLAGRFAFASLDAYALGRPYAFTQQQGNGEPRAPPRNRLARTSRTMAGAARRFPVVRAALRLAELLSRYQQLPPPRLSVAYAPGSKKTNVFRAGVGFFNDRSGPVAIADVLHSRPGGLTRYVIKIRDIRIRSLRPQWLRRNRRASYSSRPTCRFRRRCSTASAWITAARNHDPLGRYTGGAWLSHFPVARRQRAAAAALPRAPDLAYGAVRQIESHRAAGDRFAANDPPRQGDALVQRPDAVTWSRAYNDTNGIASFPATTTILAAEWAAARTSIARIVSCCSGGSAAGRVRRPLASASRGIPARRIPRPLGADVYKNGRGRARAGRRAP